MTLIQGPASNWIILRDGDAFTLVDTGYPADRNLVLASIAHLHLDPANCAAILLSHGHVDHTGSAHFFHTTYGTPVYASPAELAHVRGQEKHQVTVGQSLARAWRPRVAAWMVHAIRAGALGADVVSEARAWTQDILNELPGSPQAIVNGAHTPGHTVFSLDDGKVLLTGDSIITGHPLSARTGPQLLHPMFHYRQKEIVPSLDSFKDVPATILIPGHGPLIHLSVTDAIAQATS
ncbi:MAG: MBL fold metallo-hydrolase [Acidobacteria bacterium]|nr:MBL fold metallo-hydrolase [Acidobacteriota bacterium]